MDIIVTTRAMIPSRLVSDAAHHSSRRAFGRLQTLVKDIRLTVTDRRAKPGEVCCQLEIDLAEGTAVIVQSESASPVDALSQAFEKAAGRIRRRLRQDWMRRNSAQFRRTDAMGSHSAQHEALLNPGTAT